MTVCSAVMMAIEASRSAFAVSNDADDPVRPIIWLDFYNIDVGVALMVVSGLIPRGVHGVRGGGVATPTPRTATTGPVPSTMVMPSRIEPHHQFGRSLRSRS
jgi:hypothetical protein